MSNFARMAKRHSEQLINSVLNLEDLAECIMLSDVNGKPYRKRYSEMARKTDFDPFSRLHRGIR